jgi:2-oxoglutarate dehydrogenase E1 component
MLLPHGFEGQGPEHSKRASKDFCNWRRRKISRFVSRRMRRSISTCSAGKRRALAQAAGGIHAEEHAAPPDASSTIEDLTQPRFLPVVPDREVTDAKRILIASGKVGYDLKAERRKRKDSNTAILFLDQLYPLPRPEISAAFAAHSDARELVWVQEPRYVGPFFLCLHHQLRQLIHATTAWNLKNAFIESGAARAGPWIELCSAVRNVG